MSNHDDQVIASSRAGVALKVEKPRAVPPPSPFVGDPERSPEAPVNAAVEMPYDEAMKRRAAGTLLREVLTEKGWVQPGPFKRGKSLLELGAEEAAKEDAQNREGRK